MLAQLNTTKYIDSILKKHGYANSKETFKKKQTAVAIQVKPELCHSETQTESNYAESISCNFEGKSTFYLKTE